MKFSQAILAVSLCLGYAASAVAQTGPAKPDKVKDLMKSAYQKYDKGDLNGASTDLEEARKLVDGRRQDYAAKLFPDIASWTATKAEKENAALVGGTRLYRKYESGEKTILAEIIIDSPMVQQLAPLLNDQNIAKLAGYETRRIEGMEALIKPSGEKLELNVWIGSGILFKLTGEHTKENELVVFAKKFDFKAMGKLKKEAPEAKP
ncbi:MAG: hypothetical protein KA004_15525 [Verrucomicrobiales bacterium]|nr:hypothetical protein [Verrucomicrobiales bacterium]